MQVLVLLTLVVGGMSSPAIQVDLIELNHFYDELGRHAYDQVILWERSPDYNRFDVCDWWLVECLEEFPCKCGERFVVQHGARCISSKLFRETWTYSDPERDNKKLLDEKYRLSVFNRINDDELIRSTVSILE